MSSDGLTLVAGSDTGVLQGTMDLAFADMLTGAGHYPDCDVEGDRHDEACTLVTSLARALETRGRLLLDPQSSNANLEDLTREIGATSLRLKILAEAEARREGLE